MSTGTPPIIPATPPISPIIQGTQGLSATMPPSSTIGAQSSYVAPTQNDPLMDLSGMPALRPAQLFSETTLGMNNVVDPLIAVAGAYSKRKDFLRAFEAQFPEVKLPLLYGKVAAAKEHLANSMLERINLANDLCGHLPPREGDSAARQSVSGYEFADFGGIDLLAKEYARAKNFMHGLFEISTGTLLSSEDFRFIGTALQCDKGALHEVVSAVLSGSAPSLIDPFSEAYQPELSMYPWFQAYCKGERVFTDKVLKAYYKLMNLGSDQITCPRVFLASALSRTWANRSVMLGTWKRHLNEAQSKSPFGVMIKELCYVYPEQGAVRRYDTFGVRQSGLIDHARELLIDKLGGNFGHGIESSLVELLQIAVFIGVARNAYMPKGLVKGMDINDIRRVLTLAEDRSENAIFSFPDADGGLPFSFSRYAVAEDMKRYLGPLTYPDGEPVKVPASTAPAVPAPVARTKSEPIISTPSAKPVSSAAQQMPPIQTSQDFMRVLYPRIRVVRKKQPSRDDYGYLPPQRETQYYSWNKAALEAELRRMPPKLREWIKNFALNGGVQWKQFKGAGSEAEIKNFRILLSELLAKIEA